MISIKKKTGKPLRVDKVFYEIGKWIWLPFILLGFWFAKTGYAQYGEITACAVRRICGLPCPGCGGTRAFYHLFRGEVIQSFSMHPVVIYGVLAYLHFMLLMFYRRHISRSTEAKQIHIEYYMYAAIGVILMQWIIKLIKILLFL